MRQFAIRELLFLSRAQLFELHAHIARELVTLPQNSGDYATALENLRLIRFVLSQQNWIASLRKSIGLPPSAMC